MIEWVLLFWSASAEGWNVYRYETETECYNALNAWQISNQDHRAICYQPTKEVPIWVQKS